VAAVITATQDLWVTLGKQVLLDPLVLLLLVVLAVLLAVVLGLTVGARPVVRKLLPRKVIQPVSSPELDLVESEELTIEFDQIKHLLETHPKEALQELRRLGHLNPSHADQEVVWQSQILNAYVGSAVLDKLKAERVEGQDAASLELARAAKGAILFFDLRGFTHATEHLGGRYVMRLLNVYLRQMAEVVSAYGGVVDKFIGDNVMATFGVLEPVDNSAQNATECARAMIDRMVDINVQLSERGLPSLRPSVGLASGEMVAGTLGGVKRRSFTVIGACVNRAARLEYGTRELGVDLLMDRQTYEQLESPPWGMKVHHQVQLRGMESPVLAWSWTRPKITQGDG
jgi:class 3 adenylate cyclase